VDKAAPCPATGPCAQAAPGERVGDRPALTPRYSGSIWSTLQLSRAWRVGGGLNLRGRQTPTRAEFEVPAFVTGDLMAEWTQNTKLSWKLNLSNLSNKLYADQLYPGHYVPGAGRLLQLTASYQH
jgi:catecholate siderophore receptor